MYIEVSKVDSYVTQKSSYTYFGFFFTKIAILVYPLSERVWGGGEAHRVHTNYSKNVSLKP